jgi:hypothetical protein
MNRFECSIDGDPVLYVAKTEVGPRSLKLSDQRLGRQVITTEIRTSEQAARSFLSKDSKPDLKYVLEMSKTLC